MTYGDSQVEIVVAVSRIETGNESMGPSPQMLDCAVPRLRKTQRTPRKVTDIVEHHTSRVRFRGFAWQMEARPGG